MAYKASTYFKGNTRKPFPGGFNAGASVTILHTHVFDKDQLDFGVIAVDAAAAAPA